MPWQCVYTQASRERVAETHILNQGYVAWAPTEVIKLANRQTVQRLLFQRYLFVQFDPANNQWGRINNTRGVSHVLTSPDGMPLSIAWTEMERLFAHVGPDGMIRAPEPRQVRRGDTVKVVDGPFASFRAIVELTTRDRLTVLLSILGRSTRAEFKRDAVDLVA